MSQLACSLSVKDEAPAEVGQIILQAFCTCFLRYTCYRDMQLMIVSSSSGISLGSENYKLLILGIGLSYSEPVFLTPYLNSSVTVSSQELLTMFIIFCYLIFIPVIAVRRICVRVVPVRRICELAFIIVIAVYALAELEEVTESISSTICTYCIAQYGVRVFKELLILLLHVLIKVLPILS